MSWAGKKRFEMGTHKGINNVERKFESLRGQRLEKKCLKEAQKSWA